MKVQFALMCAWATMGCGERTCTELGCPTPIAITVLESERWAADEYEIEVATDAFDERCRLERSAANAGGSGGATGSTWSCTRTPKHFEVDVDEAGRVVVLVFERAESLELSIDELGKEWFSEEISPVYRITTPNGQGCGECARAEIEVEP